MRALRLGLSLGGLVAAVLAISRDDRRIGWVAIGFLGASVGIRVVQAVLRRRQAPGGGSLG
jgi:hypothetical protein